MRTAVGSMFGGRRSMSWWATIIIVFLFFFFSATECFSYIHEKNYNNYIGTLWGYYFENLEGSVGITALFAAGFSWIFIPWRMQLPVIFNRRTQTVTCFINGHLATSSWEGLEAYIKDVTTFAAGGVPANDGVLTLVLHSGAPEGLRRSTPLRVGITATKDADEAFFNRGIYGAAMLWEYIRLYMRVGADALPPSSAISSYRAASIRECVSFWNPFRLFRSRSWWKRLLAPFLFPVAAPVLWLITVGDLIYMGLDRILPRRKWPQELIDACDGEWDGRED
ncbi:hypothetical protein [Pseudomonas protegens]|uniref:hypothetical protein n=1 Tax=Pseudomonas protegens TaxID=380021 RepID=UPI001F2E01D2|nr:hypothetical protein [Pseudomonas protegens]